MRFLLTRVFDYLNLDRGCFGKNKRSGRIFKKTRVSQ